MNIEQCDHYCDQFEARLQNGERLSPEEFIHECGLPPNEQLMAELRNLEREYGTKPYVSENDPADPGPP